LSISESPITTTRAHPGPGEGVGRLERSPALGRHRHLGRAIERERHRGTDRDQCHPDGDPGADQRATAALPCGKWRGHTHGRSVRVTRGVPTG
jgi:hypothetical protein